MEIIKFISFIVRIGTFMAFCGQLKFCTLVMLDKAGEKTQKGMIPYAKYTRLLTENK